MLITCSCPILKLALARALSLQIRLTHILLLFIAFTRYASSVFIYVRLCVQGNYPLLTACFGLYKGSFLTMPSKHNSALIVSILNAQSTCGCRFSAKINESSGWEKSYVDLDGWKGASVILLCICFYHSYRSLLSFESATWWREWHLWYSLYFSFLPLPHSFPPISLTLSSRHL